MQSYPIDIHTHRLVPVPGESIVSCLPDAFFPQKGGWYSVGIHPWQLGRCGYRLPALSHCFTPFITYRAFRGRDITNGYDSVETHFKQRLSGRTNMILAFPFWSSR